VSKKAELKASTAAPRQPQQDRSDKRAPAYSLSQPYPDDPAVVARTRGAFVDDKGKYKSPDGNKSGRPQQPRGPPPLGAYSIAQFCEAHSISQSFFFKLLAAGRGPAVMRVGARTLVSAEAALAWRKAHEADATGNQSTNNEAPPPAA
jgi:hypothetical protein